MGVAVLSKEFAQPATDLGVERQKASQINLDLGSVELVAEPADGRLEGGGRDGAQLVVFSDQTILVGNLKFVEKTDDQLLAAAEMQGYQQRRGQCMVRAHDARQVVDPPTHRELANTGVPKSERERDGVVGLVARRQVAVE